MSSVASVRQDATVAYQAALVLRSYVLLAFPLALSLRAAPVLHAQRAPEPGQRVRFELRDGRTLTARVQSLTSDSIRLTASHSSDPSALHRDSVFAFRQSIGRSHSAGARRGAKIGALIGGGLGLLIFGAGVAYDATGHCDECFFSASMITGLYGSGLLVAGTASGLAVGALLGRERWGPRVSLVLELPR